MMHILSAALFAISANLDNFAIGMAYGMKKTRIHIWHNGMIAIFSGAGTYISMALGGFLGSFIAMDAANRAGSGMLVFMGLWFIGAYFFHDANKGQEGEVSQACQACQTCLVGRKEAFALSLALAANNMGLGLGASITGLDPVATSICTIVFSMAFIALGQAMGKTCLSALFGKYANLASGGIILALGVYEFFV